MVDMLTSLWDTTNGGTNGGVLGPGPADVTFQFPKENTLRLGCAMKYHHYVIMILPFFW